MAKSNLSARVTNQPVIGGQPLRNPQLDSRLFRQPSSAGKLYFNSMDRVLAIHQHAGQSHPFFLTLSQLRQANTGIIGRLPLQSTRRTTATVNVRKIMQACMVGQFIAETRAGRDAIATSYLAHLDKTKVRHGLDAFFLMVLCHLQQTKAAGLSHALQLWAATPSTAVDGEVVFDPRNNSLATYKAIAFDSKLDPFKDGLATNNIFHTRGDEVMDGPCEVVVSAAGTIGGALIGGLIGGKIGKPEQGKQAGEWIGGVIGGLVGPPICGWIEGSEPIDDGKGGAGPIGPSDNPGGPIGPGDDTGGPIGPGGGDGPTGPTGPEGGGDTGPTGPGGGDTGPTGPGGGDTGPSSGPTDPGPSPDGGGEGYPPPSGMPAPDDGGGSPWSFIGVSSIISLSQAKGLMTQAATGGFTVNAFTPLTEGQFALNSNQSLLANLSVNLTTNPQALASLQGLAKGLMSKGIPAISTTNVVQIAAVSGH